MGNGSGGQLKCYTGLLDDNTQGMVIAYSQAQAQKLLGFGHRRYYGNGWRRSEVDPDALMATGLRRFVVYHRPLLNTVGMFGGWQELGE